MRYRLFGKTCAKVSEVGFGGWAVGGDAAGNSYGPTDDDEAIDALRAAYDIGCNFFDTADVYGAGHGEELIAKALGSHRAGCLLATKAGYDASSDPPAHRFDKDYLVGAAEASLGRLQTDYVDLLQLHNPPAEALQSGEAYEALDELKAAGKIRWAGISVNTTDEVRAAIASERFEAVQIRFNLVDLRMAEVFRELKEARLGVIVREPLANGLLLGKYEPGHAFADTDIRGEIPDELFRRCVDVGNRLDPLLNESTTTRAQLCIKFPLAFDMISTVIAGIKDEEQLEDDMEPGIGDPITREEFEALQAIIGELPLGAGAKG